MYYLLLTLLSLLSLLLRTLLGCADWYYCIITKLWDSREPTWPSPQFNPGPRSDSARGSEAVGRQSAVCRLLDVHTARQSPADVFSDASRKLRRDRVTLTTDFYRVCTGHHVTSTETSRRCEFPNPDWAWSTSARIRLWVPEYPYSTPFPNRARAV